MCCLDNVNSLLGGSPWDLHLKVYMLESLLLVGMMRGFEWSR